MSPVIRYFKKPLTLTGSLLNVDVRIMGATNRV